MGFSSQLKLVGGSDTPTLITTLDFVSPTGIRATTERLRIDRLRKPPLRVVDQVRENQHNRHPEPYD